MSAQSHPARNAGRSLMAFGVLIAVGAFAIVFWLMGVDSIDRSVNRLLASLIENRQDLWCVFQVLAAVAASFFGVLVAASGWVLVKLVEQDRREVHARLSVLQQAAQH